MTKTRGQREGALDGYVWATLGKPFDVVSPFNRALALRDVIESDRADYADAFGIAYRAECAAMRMEGRP